MPKCEEKEGKYYDDKGNEVDKVTFLKVCIKMHFFVPFRDVFCPVLHPKMH